MDGLKQINDELGHLIGSRAVCRFAETLEARAATPTRPPATAATSSSSCCPARTTGGADLVIGRHDGAALGRRRVQPEVSRSAPAWRSIPATAARRRPCSAPPTARSMRSRPTRRGRVDGASSICSSGRVPAEGGRISACSPRPWHTIQRPYGAAARLCPDVRRSRSHASSRHSNRHGLITGATGTGKTVTLQVLAERFSRSACRRSWPT